MRTLTILLTSLTLVLTGCGGHDSTKPRPAHSKGSASATEEAAPEPIMLGTQRYVSPCRLLDRDDVRRIYPGFGPYATFDQDFLERGVSTREMRSISETVGASVRTTCSYWLNNKQETTIELGVNQYLSPARATKAWKDIRTLGTGKDSEELAKSSAEQWLIDLARENEAHLGGVPVPGTQGKVLYVAHQGDFVTTHGNLLLTVSRKDYTGSVFMPRRVKDVTQVRDVFATIHRHASESDLDQSAVPAYWEQPEGWPTFVDPCQVFDDEAMVTATGHTSANESPTSGSTFLSPAARMRRNTLPAFQAVDNTCERSAKIKRPHKVLSDYWSGRAEVWYAAPGTAEGKTLLDGLVIKRLFPVEKQRKFKVGILLKGKVLRPVEVAGADTAYLFDYTKDGFHVRWVMAKRGPYVTVLSADKPAPRAKWDRAPVDERRLLAGTARVIANLQAATEG